MTTEQKLEALLFWKNESVTVEWLAKALALPADEIVRALDALGQSLAGSSTRGIVLQRNGNEAMLKTHPDASALIESLSKDELVKELTPSALETLSIILYRGPLAKKDIDYIRGVNSGFILRSLLIRGLIQKEEGADARSVAYRASLDLMSLLGITRLEDLEEYASVKSEIEAFKKKDAENGEYSTA
jgi:segregation and condensation protein B